MGKHMAEQIQQARGNYGTSRKTMLKEQKKNHYPRTAEPAMIHPMTNSAIKLRNNGMIDIFVGTDNGLRIDPATRTINVIGNTYKHHVDSIKSNIRKHVNQNVGIHWNLNTGGNVNIQAKGKVSIEAASKLSMEASEIDLKTSSLNVEVSGTFASKAGLYDFRT